MNYFKKILSLILVFSLLLLVLVIPSQALVTETVLFTVIMSVLTAYGIYANAELITDIATDFYNSGIGEEAFYYGLNDQQSKLKVGWMMLSYVKNWLLEHGFSINDDGNFVRESAVLEVEGFYPDIEDDIRIVFVNGLMCLEVEDLSVLTKSNLKLIESVFYFNSKLSLDSFSVSDYNFYFIPEEYSKLTFSQGFSFYRDSWIYPYWGYRSSWGIESFFVPPVIKKDVNGNYEMFIYSYSRVAWDKTFRNDGVSFFSYISFNGNIIKKDLSTGRLYYEVDNIKYFIETGGLTYDTVWNFAYDIYFNNVVCYPMVDLDLNDTDIILSIGFEGVLDKVDTLIDAEGNLIRDIEGIKDAVESIVDNMVISDELADELADVEVPSIELEGFDGFSVPKLIITKFPFCIPFDLYRIMSPMVQTSKQLDLNFTFRLPILNTNYTLNLDDGGIIDDNINLIRYFFLGLFVLGLAMATKRLTWGSE